MLWCTVSASNYQYGSDAKRNLWREVPPLPCSQRRVWSRWKSASIKQLTAFWADLLTGLFLLKAFGKREICLLRRWDEMLVHKIIREKGHSLEVWCVAKRFSTFFTFSIISLCQKETYTCCGGTFVKPDGYVAYFRQLLTMSASRN